VRHFGDYGNIVADENERALVHIVDHVNRLNGEEVNIMDKILVVHADEDDLGDGDNAESKVSGNSGARVACCQIRNMPYHYI